MIRVALPAHLRTLAGVSGEVQLTGLPGQPGNRAVTLAEALDALEARYPALRGTIRDRVTGHRRAFVRFFACQEDLSQLPADTPLPADVVTGTEPLLIVGAMAGG
jgi:sulfur-carrier protein